MQTKTIRNLCVYDAQKVQAQTGHEIVIVLAVSPTTGELEFASYGVDKSMCALGKNLVDTLFEHVKNMMDDPARITAGLLKQGGGK